MLIALKRIYDLKGKFTNDRIANRNFSTAIFIENFLLKPNFGFVLVYWRSAALNRRNGNLVTFVMAMAGVATGEYRT